MVDGEALQIPPAYLKIEPFLQDALQARILEEALTVGVIDQLESGSASIEELTALTEYDEAGRDFLLQSLQKSGVVECTQVSVQLSAAFRETLPFRDLLTTRLKFANAVSADFFTHLPSLLKSEEKFMQVARLFELFDYNRCLLVNTPNCLHASNWMQLTSMQSRYEGPVCHQHFDFGQHERMLDVGGNSGEFAIQVCRRTPNLQATVFDLPVVSAVGKRHVQATDSDNRIQFVAGDMRADDFPSGCDLVSWKSVLHDWPDEAVQMLLKKSLAALPSGGRLLIFERQQWDFSVAQISYGLLPLQLFFRSYRQPSQYVAWLHACGFTQIEVQSIALELPFTLITACKPSL